MKHVALFFFIILGAQGCGATSASVSSAATTTTVKANVRGVQRFLEGTKQAKLPQTAAKERAIVAFEDALRMEPNLWEAHYNLGVLYRQQASLEEAIKHFKAAYAIEPNSTLVALGLAETQRAQGDLDESIDTLRALTKRKPEALDVRTSLAATLREAGKTDDALSEAREVLVRNPGNVAALVEVGRIYRAKKGWEVSELVFDKALKISPKGDKKLIATIYTELGLVALGQGDTQTAFGRFEQATSIEPNFLPARLNRASVLLNAGDYAGAATQYRGVLSDEPRHLESHIGLGVALRGQGKHKEAQKEYETVLDIDSNYADALYNFGILKADFLNDRGGAVPLFQKFLSVAPKSNSQRTTAERYIRDIESEQKAAPSAKGKQP